MKKGRFGEEIEGRGRKREGEGRVREGRMGVSPLEDKGHVHMSRSPTRECQNSRHLTCWRISEKES